MPRTKNNENRCYPNSWRFRYDAYYYRLPKGQEGLWDGRREFHLGRSPGEDAAEWAKCVHQIEHGSTVDALLTRYKLDVIPTKAAATRRGDIQSLINLRKVFGAMRPRDAFLWHRLTTVWRIAIHTGASVANDDHRRRAKRQDDPRGAPPCVQGGHRTDGSRIKSLTIFGANSHHLKPTPLVKFPRGMRLEHSYVAIFGGSSRSYSFLTTA